MAVAVKVSFKVFCVIVRLLLIAWISVLVPMQSIVQKGLRFRNDPSIELDVKLRPHGE